MTVWVTQWRTDEDAGDFSYALERCLQARFPGESIEADQQRGGQVLRRADRVYRIARSGVEVVLRVAPPAIDAKMGPGAKKKGPAPRQASAKNLVLTQSVQPSSVSLLKLMAKMFFLTPVQVLMNLCLMKIFS